MSAAVVSPQRPGGLLWERNFRLLWFGETINRLGSGVTGVALPLIAVQILGADAVTMGLIEAAAWLPWLLIGLPAGAWIDRWACRPVLIACDLASLVLFVSVPVCAWLGLLTVPQLIVTVLLAGVSTVFFTTAYQAFLPSVVSAEQLPEGNAKLQGSEQVATIAGPSIGGLLAQTFGAVMGLLVNAATFLVSVICLSGIRVSEDRARRQAPGRRLYHEVGTGLAFLFRDPYLRILSISGAVDNLTLSGVHALLVLFLSVEVGADAALVGLLLAVDSVGGLIGAFLAGPMSRRFGTGRALLLCSLAPAPFALLIPLTADGPRLLLFAAGLIVPSVGMVACSVIASGFRQRYCPPELLARVFSGARFLQFGVIPVGAILGGTLGALLGVREALWILVAAGVVGKLVRFIGPLSRQRELPTEPPR